jgi:BirA family transcriptional regulator, biotin operon repressor / biotin---[acetyl-CoA-carboxylase] ligase
VNLSTSTQASLNIALLNRLRAAEGDYVPLGELGPDLQRLQFDLEALVNYGFGVEQHPYRGVAYRGPAMRLCPDQIEHGLATERIGRRIAVWNRVTSTNDLAARAGTSLSNDGLVILAEEQTAGRGRRGRSWAAPACSSILMSVVLFPPPHLALPEAAFGCAWLTALAAVATAELVTAWTGRDARIKWPNDIRIDGRKVAGILVERVVTPARHDAESTPDATSTHGWGAVIGIGLNVNLAPHAFPAELVPSATSMQVETGGELFDRSEVVRDLIERLDHWYGVSRARGIDILNSPWQARSEHLAQTVRITTTTASLIGRLVAIDLKRGLTMAVAGKTRQQTADEKAIELVCIPIADVLMLEGDASGTAYHVCMSD